MPSFFFNVGLSLLLVSSCITGCRPPDKAETSAYYVAVDSFAVTDTDGVTRIDDYSGQTPHFWCFANGAAGGVAELKTPLPLPLNSGNVNLFLYAGMYADGVAQARVEYPFLSAFQKQETPTEGAHYRYRPTVQWVKELKRPFPFQEDFEHELSVDTGQLVNNNLPKVPITIGTEGVHPAGGTRYGMMEAPADGKARSIEMVQIAKKTLPQLGQPLYLEMLYRNSVPFTVGLRTEVAGLSSPVNIVDVVVRENPGGWKKLYVYLADEAQSAPPGSQFQVLIRAPATGAAGEYLHVDNLRLMHLK